MGYYLVDADMVHYQVEIKEKIHFVGFKFDQLNEIVDFKFSQIL